MNEFDLKQFVGEIISGELNAYHNRISVLATALWKLRAIDTEKAIEMHRKVREIGEQYGKLLSEIEREVITLGE